MRRASTIPVGDSATASASGVSRPRREFLGMMGSTAAFLASRTGALAQQKPIKIGISTALTGAVAYGGTAEVRAAQIAADEINAKGGIDGRPIVLVTRDDEHNPTKHVANVRELVEKEGVNIVMGPTTSPGGLAVAPIINGELKVPWISPISSATDIVRNQAWRDKQPNYMFRYSMYDAGQLTKIVDFAVANFTKNKLAILVENSGLGEAGRTEMDRQLREKGIPPVAVEQFNFRDVDMTAQLGRIQRAGGEGILYVGQVAEATAMMRTTAKLDYHPNIISIWGIANGQFWSNVKDLGEGVYVATTATPDGPQSPEREAFVAEFEKRHGKGSLTAFPFALHSYDVVKVIDAAMRKGGSDDPAKLRAALEEIPTFKGLLKGFDRPLFTAERHDALLPEDLIVCRWTKGKMLAVT